jgi:glycosyltransferase involved in cell wall biosynthesis
MPLPVSVQIITLNEEANIAACIDAVLLNDPAEIVVIDGGSSDRTVEIAEARGARVIAPGRLGRGASRTLGYHSTEQPYTAMVDADDRIAPDWLPRMLEELTAGGYAALQSSLRTVSEGTFWERGWNEYFVESVRPVADTIMVGHPALYVTADLQAARDDIGHDHEDTQLSVDFQARGLRQGIGTALSYRVVPTDRDENLHKWRMYGKGYRDFVARHPDRRTAILKHMVVTIPIVRGWRPVLRGKLEQPVFGALMSGAIIYGYVRGRGSS